MDKAPTDATTAAFAEHRERLSAIAYNILGEVADAEDVLQEAWLSWAGADHDRIDNPRAYLVRIVVNESMSQLRRVQRRRETYVGPWLPDPLITEADAADRALEKESVSLALMVVLESLTPLERAVFVLHEAFGYRHDEIGGMLDRTPAAVRQLAHRAREHVQARRPRATVGYEVRKAATERFLAAAAGGDLSTLMEILAPDVTLWTDSGGKARAARRVITGRDKIVRFLTSAEVAGEMARLTIRYVAVNGDPAALAYDGDRLQSVGLLDLDDDGAQIRAIYGIANPDKLRRIAEIVDPEAAAPT